MYEQVYIFMETNMSDCVGELWITFAYLSIFIAACVDEDLKLLQRLHDYVQFNSGEP